MDFWRGPFAAYNPCHPEEPKKYARLNIGGYLETITEGLKDIKGHKNMRTKKPLGLIEVIPWISHTTSSKNKS